MRRAERSWRVLLGVALAACLRVASGCGDESQPCECADGFYCPVVICPKGCADSCPAPHCEKRGSVGDRCLDDTLNPRTCLDGLLCNTALGDCQPLQPIGSRCLRDKECQGWTREAGPLCDHLRQICAAPGTQALGEPCTAERACGPDLTCSGPYSSSVVGYDVVQTCLAALPENASCAQLPDACADGLTCQGGACRRP